MAVRDDGSPGDAGGHFGVPVPIPLLAPGELAQDPTLTADELDLFFASDKNGDLDIWTTSRPAIGRPWGPARRVDELSTTSADGEPEVSPDGLTLYFSSDRTGAAGGFRIWISRRAQRADPWDTPLALALGAGTSFRGPAVDSRSVTLVFASVGDSRDFDLYAASRPSETAPWETPALITEVNTPWYDWDPALYRDGLGLAFGSRRDGDHTASDLFQSVRASATAPFSAGEALSELNTAASEGDPWLSNDGQHIVFASERDGVSKIYEAWRAAR